MTLDDVTDYLSRQVKIPFAWGSADCVHFAAGLHGISLTDFAYSTKREALEQIAEAGSLRELVSGKLGEPQPVKRGGTEIEAGDVVLTTYGGIGEIVGIAAPPHAWYRLDDRRGLVPAPLEQCLYFWRPACPPQ